MTRIVQALALALSLATASAAFAAPPARDRQGQAAHKGNRKDKDDEKRFPMKADEFKKLVAERVGKARERMEKHISQKNVPEDKAKVLRAKFEVGVAVLNRKVDKVCEDGTVTKEEAREVRELVHRMVQEHHKEHGKGHKKDKKLACAAWPEARGHHQRARGCPRSAVLAAAARALGAAPAPRLAPEGLAVAGYPDIDILQEAHARDGAHRRA